MSIDIRIMYMCVTLSLSHVMFTWNDLVLPEKS